MALYDSYLDEDFLDETITESYDLGDDYDEGAEDFDEARRRRARRGSWRNRQRSSRAQSAGGPVTPGGVKRAFNTVSDELGSVRRQVRLADNSRATAFGVDILGTALLAPKIEVDADGKPFIKDNLVPLIGLKLIGNMIGSGSKLDFRKVLPWVLAALLVSPNSLKQLGINTGAESKEGQRGLLGNLDNTTLLLLGGIVYFAASKK